MLPCPKSSIDSYNLSWSSPNYLQVFKTHHNEAAKYISILIPNFVKHNPLAPDQPEYFYTILLCSLDIPHLTSLLSRVVSFIHSKFCQSLKIIQVSYYPEYLTVHSDFLSLNTHCKCYGLNVSPTLIY